MSLEVCRAALGWCTVINVSLLIWWAAIFWLAHDWMYSYHRKIAKLSVEAFDAIHYGGIALYKLGILLFNLVPYLALHWIN